nr:uncharacterized protein LOC109164445 [Ipomoea batatas]
MKLDNSSGDHPEEDDSSNQVQQISLIKALIGGDDGRYDHNFTLPSCLKWGHQKRVRWMKFDNPSCDHPEEDDECMLQCCYDADNVSPLSQRSRAFDNQASTPNRQQCSKPSSTIKTGSSDRSNDGGAMSPTARLPPIEVVNSPYLTISRQSHGWRGSRRPSHSPQPWKSRRLDLKCLPCHRCTRRLDLNIDVALFEPLFVAILEPLFFLRVPK